MAANEDPLEQAIAAQEEAMDSLPDDELAEAAGPRQLSFSFAKRHHVLLETNTDRSGHPVLHRSHAICGIC